MNIEETIGKFNLFDSHNNVLLMIYNINSPICILLNILKIRIIYMSCTADTFYFLLLFNPILFCLIEPNICYSLYVIQSLCSYCKRGRSLPTSLSPVSSNKGI
uniref:Uncharacterized protein n=1 Tax=Heterorhabditis bacteriophora TaxID=37862 RepID=A0A1I7W8E8_HETBA